MKSEYKISLVILAVGILGMGGAIFYKKVLQKPKEPPKIQQIKEQIVLPDLNETKIYKNLPIVKSYLKDVREAVKNGSGVVPLRESELDDGGKVAQDILLKSREFLRDNIINSRVTHSDMMRITPVNISDLRAEEREVCKRDNCYKAQKYNFFTNSTTEAIVDTSTKKILSIRRYSNSQPDISLRLKRIAEAIALNSPKVAKELKHKPRRFEMSMANVRTALQGGSPCEDSSHLCVAPTFAIQKEQKALWAIVDLSELKLVAAKWAGLGKTTTPSCISERVLENRYIVENFCKKSQNFQKDGWSINYQLTTSDGLEVRDVEFKGKKVLKSAKVVDWHVAYRGLDNQDINSSEPVYIAGRRVEFVKGDDGSYLFGYNDAMGCPMFSTSVVLAFNAPQITDIRDDKNSTIGFAITQDFRNPKWPMACNYRYENRFEFYRDGSFRVVAINKGRGCADKAVYRPVMRIDLFDGEAENFSIFDSKGWRSWEKEDRYYSTSQEKRFRDKFLYKIETRSGNGYYIEPNRGEFNDHSRGDHERVYISKFREGEGDTDMLTVGSCCNLSLDGIESFVNGESIKDSNIVLWYVPRIKNDDRKGQEYCWADTVIGEDGNLKVRVWPCIVGPKFVPIRERD